MSKVATALFAYSEWLDQQGLIVGEDASGDKRSHDALVSDFLNSEEAGN